MKELIKISLVVIFVCVLFQIAAGGSMASTSKIDSSLASGTFFTADTSVENVHTAACLVNIKGVTCVRPNVGWNS